MSCDKILRLTSVADFISLSVSFLCFIVAFTGFEFGFLRPTSSLELPSGA